MGFFKKKKKGLWEGIKGLFGLGVDREVFYQELEEKLLESDIGVKTSMEVSQKLRQLARSEKLKTKEDLYQGLRAVLEKEILSTTMDLREGLNLFLVLGVNGVGKTTTIGKIAKLFQKSLGQGILLAAGDTFRAAAVSQLQQHGKKLGIRVVAQQQGSDPGAVIYDALDSAQSKGERLVIADTAGRMHNKENLVKELQKIHKIAEKKMEGRSYKKILVLDATTGQNALSQAKIFQEAVGVDALVLTKMDSTGKGGIGVAISSQLGLPFAFLGVGESQDDLIIFETQDYLDRLLGDL